MFEKFDIDEKNIFKVCVVATMSSGKSTFINSIIGEEVMPEKNEACTARTMAVLDNDAAIVKTAHIIRKNGIREIVKIDSREVLDRINNDDDVMDFLVETDIKSIKNTSRALLLVDTPGVNNSGDERHGERTEEFLKRMDMGVIIYLLNATQLATNDDSLLLQLVSEHVKRQKGKVKIIFVVNKIDALDEETESIDGTVKIAKEYIQNHNIQNPVIYPLSALAAKSLRMALYRKKMTRRELRKLEDIYDHYKSRDNNMLDYALLDDLSEALYEIGDETISAQQLRRAIDNTGITAIERKLERFMLDIEKHYAPEVVIKPQISETSAQQFQKRLEMIASIPSQCEWEKFEGINKKIELDVTIQKTNILLQDVDTVVVSADMSENISDATSEIEDLLSDIEKIKESVFEAFEQEKYIAVKRVDNLYFCPEKNEKSRIRIKNFYLMSEDGKIWKSLHFGQMIAFMDIYKEFYLYNEYSSWLFKVTKENSSDVIALLDIKFPMRIIKIAGFNREQPTFDDVKNYINAIVDKKADERRKIENAQEQLRRTYKGIVFKSEVEKNKAIRQEEEMKKYCLSLKEKSFEELWNKKEAISKLPNTIFAGYISKVILALDVQENREKNEYLARIKTAKLSDLERMDSDLQKCHYSDSAKASIIDAIAQRRFQCQRTILETSVKNIDIYSREELKSLIQEIENRKFESSLTAKFIGKVNNQYDILEEKELRELCADINQKDIKGLENLESEIRTKRYQDKLAVKYIEMISSRKDFLYIKKIEQYCMPIQIVDRQNLEAIKKKIDEENCNLVLKNRFYELVKQREERLDYEDLCLLIDGIESKPLEELEVLYQELREGRYNPKFIKSFLLLVRVNLESAQKRHIGELIKNLNSMDKNQVISVEETMDQLGYNDRVAALAKDKTTERRYILDMYELIKMENNFDRLYLNDIEKLRNEIKQKDVCERSQITYMKKLHERERVIAYQLVSSAACFTKQIMDQYGLTGLDIKIPTFSPDYMHYLEMYYASGGEYDYRNIPILIYPDCSALAINKTTLYCLISSGYTKINLVDIRSFSVEKKFFSQVLAITLTNGNVITLSGGIDKKVFATFAQFLTTVIQNINNEVVLRRYRQYDEHISGLTEKDFELHNVLEDITEQYIVKILMKKYGELENKIAKRNPIKCALHDNWFSIEQKIRIGFGILKERQIVLYYDKTFLNSAKEGIAFGVEYVHIKLGNQSLVSIPYIDIFEITEQPGKMVITTITNNIFSVDMSLDSENFKTNVISLLDEYMRGIQLVNSLNIRVKTENANFVMTEPKMLENKCPKCGEKIRHGAKFCSNCGIKVEAEDASVEYIYCTQCGYKIIKGKKFCSNCGNKVG